MAGSASRDETRPVLTGILVSASDRELRMVATDSYRLSVKETLLEASLPEGFEVNVPARALQELARVAGHGEADELQVSVRQSQVLFTVGRFVLSSRLIDGQFPNYRQLMPEAFEHELRIAGAELTDVVRRISLLAQKNAPLRLAFAPGELTISAQTPDVGEAMESLPVEGDGKRLHSFAHVRCLCRNRQLAGRKCEPQGRILLRQQADPAHDIGELGAGDPQLMLESLRNQLAVIGELPVYQT